MSARVWPYLLVEGLHPHAAQNHALGQRPAKARLDRVVEDELLGDIGEDVLDLGVALLLDTVGHIGLIMAHHQHRRGVGAVDQQADLFIDRKIEGADGAGAAAGLEPGLGGLEQRREDRLVVLGGDHAEITVRRGRIGAREMIDLGADPADVAAVADRQPELHVGMLEERIGLGRERLASLEHQRRYPVGIAFVQSHRHADEPLQFSGRTQRDGSSKFMLILPNGARG